jgi:hypothetical protein
MFFFRYHGPRGRRQGLLPPAAGQNDNDPHATTTPTRQPAIASL